MHICFRENSYVFRSKGLFAFLRVLQEAHPGWVDMASLVATLPGTGPRQLARYLDSLEDAGLALVSYETKTRGPFRLAVAPETISFAGTPLPDVQPRTALPAPASVEALDVFLAPAWVAWVLALLHATLATHEGALSGEEGALSYLDSAETAAAELPTWAAAVVHVHRAHILERESRYREAAHCLKRVETAVRQGHAHPVAASRAQIIRAKMRYDQARYDEAERLLGLLPHQGDFNCPHSLNMQALLAGRKFLNAGDEEAPRLLAQALSHLAEALGLVFLWHGDSSLLNALCYNFGNNLLRGVRRGMLPDSCADTAMQWLAANLLACRKLGIGDDSVLTNLLLVDVGLEHGYSMARWPPLLRQGLNAYGTLEDLLTASLADARGTGHRLELAHCLLRQVRMVPSEAGAAEAYQEAAELFAELGQKDKLAVLADSWRSRFGTAPPTRARGRRA